METKEKQALTASLDWLEFTIIGIAVEKALTEILQLPVAEFSPPQ